MDRLEPLLRCSMATYGSEYRGSYNSQINMTSLAENLYLPIRPSANCRRASWHRTRGPEAPSPRFLASSLHHFPAASRADESWDHLFVGQVAVIEEMTKKLISPKNNESITITITNYYSVIHAQRRRLGEERTRTRE